MQSQLYAQQQVTVFCLPLSVLLNPQCFGEGILPVRLCDVQAGAHSDPGGIPAYSWVILTTPRPFPPRSSDPIVISCPLLTHSQTGKFFTDLFFKNIFMYFFCTDMACGLKHAVGCRSLLETVDCAWLL